MADMSFSCSSCGSELEAPEAYAGRTIKCPQCSVEIVVPASAPPPQPPPVAAPQNMVYLTPTPTVQPKTCGFAIAALVLGLVPCTCLPSILAIVFGHIALSKIDKSNGQLKGRGMAMWGLVLGYIFTVINIIYGIICGIKAARG